jgi:cyanocobalamin reductase (cyanide-eliminating) / alkylcobalamin dealkylase
VPDHERIDERIYERVRAACAGRGLDLAQPLCASWYNRTAEPQHRLPDHGRASALVVVLGNTRALWPRLADALAADAELASHPDPVDRYCERVVHEAMAGVAEPWLVRFAHDPPPRVAIQRLAHVAGLAHLAPTHLSVHPVYGPWIALRAAVVVDVDGPPGPAPVLAAPCDCAAHCAPRFEAALARAGAAVPGHAQVESDWRAWLAVRDACPVGRAHRYGEEQLRYHYTKDRRSLPGPGRG